jgi:hypothetical protein
MRRNIARPVVSLSPGHLNPELMTFEKWLVKNKNLIPLQ